MKKQSSKRITRLQFLVGAGAALSEVVAQAPERE